jgi:hypothetical protein
MKLGPIFDFVVRGMPLSCGDEYFRDSSAMITMGACPGCNGPQEIPRNDRIRIRTADPHLGTIPVRIDPTGSHCTYTATNTQFPEAALGLLLIKPVPRIRLIGPSHVINNILGRFIATTFFRIHKNLSLQIFACFPSAHH